MCSGDLSDSGVKPTSLTFPALAGGFFTTAAAAAAAKSLQSCLTLCDPIDGSPPGSPVPGFSRQQHWSGLSFPSPLEPPKGSLAKDNSVQFSSVAQLCPTLCDPMDCSMPGLPVHHQLPELTQTHIHGVSDAIQPCHPWSSPSPPTLNLSQHQGLFQ